MKFLRGFLTVALTITCIIPLFQLIVLTLKKVGVLEDKPYE